MIKVYINNKMVFIPFGSTILEACQTIKIEIPKFCFHRKLKIAGNCRMCIVEVEKVPKPVVSCSFPINNNIKIFTESPLVKKARENILEFLLVNHPLDCPICDQAGECDLQEQTSFFGVNRSRFFGFKRIVEDKNCSLFVKTVMTRCIHCTRCIRFIKNVFGFSDLGVTSRGKQSEIGTYLKKNLKSEFSGNIIDLCPVGALTAKNYAFIARPWEIKTYTSLDFSDAVGLKIKVGLKESEIIKILPYLKDNLNENWISDKTRFSFDNLKIQRIKTPFIKKNSRLVLTSWKKAFEKIKLCLVKLKKDRNLHNLFFLVNFSLDLKELEKIKNFSNSFNLRNFGSSRIFLINLDFLENFIFNTSIKNFSLIDLFCLIGTNLRYEAPILNLKMKKAINFGLLNLLGIGIPFFSYYKMPFFGISPKILLQIVEGKHTICKKLRIAKNPLFVLNTSVCERVDFFAIKKILTFLETFLKLKNKNWNSFSILNQESNQTGHFFLGIHGISKSFLKNTSKITFFKGAFKKMEEFFPSRQTESFFFSSHGTENLLKASVILPVSSPLEKGGFFMNFRGLIQKVAKIPTFSSSLEEKIKIFDNFSLKKEKKISYFSFFQNFRNFSLCASSNIRIKKKSFFGKSLIYKIPFNAFINDFFKNDFCSGKSFMMLKSSEHYKQEFTNFSRHLRV